MIQEARQGTLRHRLGGDSFGTRPLDIQGAVDRQAKLRRAQALTDRPDDAPAGGAGQAIVPSVQSLATMIHGA
eukprot:8993789-Pyramimonas_sp.AAC.1